MNINVLTVVRSASRSGPRRLPGQAANLSHAASSGPRLPGRSRAPTRQVRQGHPYPALLTRRFTARSFQHRDPSVSCDVYLCYFRNELFQRC